MSLICGSLTWLVEQKKAASLPAPPSTDPHSWVTDFKKDRDERERKARMERKKQRWRRRLERQGSSTFSPEGPIKRSATSSNSTDEESSDDDDDDDSHLQLIYCSRTHSQLTQFVHELSNTRFDLSVVVLASRRHTCINEDVSTHASSAAMAEHCLDMQGTERVRDAQKATKRFKAPAGVFGVTVSRPSPLPRFSACPLFSLSSQRLFRDEMLRKIYDLEAAVAQGRRFVACPYYGLRRAAKRADVIVLPYGMIVHRDTRSALGLRIAGNVVVVDEAHNLADAVAQSHSVLLPWRVLGAAGRQLRAYVEKYRPLMKPATVVHLNQAIRFADGIARLVTATASAPNAATKLMTVNEFTFALNLDNVNLFSLLAFLKERHIARKVTGFCQSGDQSAGVVSAEERAGARSLFSFLDCLNREDSDGRVLILPEVNAGTVRPTEWSVKYTLLNPAIGFRDVIDEARAVLFAGGTLQPMDAMIAQLCPHLSESRINKFSCGHVVPKDNLSVLAVEQGPCGKPFRFTFEERGRADVIKDLGAALANLCSVVPEGMVVFFPSYKYEDEVLGAFEKEGTMDRIRQKKRVFREPHGVAGGLEATLRDYTHQIESGRGALLTAVVGGKMSEGINFSDGLGRCIVMIGMPYPNKNDPELKEKSAFVDMARSGKGGDFVENMCMRGVNQSIGRAIRHKGDCKCLLNA